MLKANFNITEAGGTGLVQLQSSSDQGATWQNVGSLLTLTDGALTVDDNTDIEIDTSVFIPGASYEFRLIDHEGSPVSNVYTAHVPSITGYSAGVSVIDFDHTGGDNWSVTFHIAPASIQSTTGATITGYSSQVNFWLAQNNTTLDSSSQATDHTVSVGGHGAGIYEMICFYTFSDGREFVIKRMTKVDNAGNILADIQLNGITVNSVSGLTANVSSHIVQTGVSYSTGWLAGDNTNTSPILAFGTPADITIAPGYTLILGAIDISTDAIFTTDYSGDPLFAGSVTIS